jgi:hypothetical protein
MESANTRMRVIKRDDFVIYIPLGDHIREDDFVLSSDMKPMDFSREEALEALDALGRDIIKGLRLLKGKYGIQNEYSLVRASRLSL